MNDMQIPIEACRETLDNGRTLYNDPRIGPYPIWSASTQLTAHRDSARIILLASERSGYIKPEQINRLDTMFEFYQKVRSLNDSYDEDLAVSVVSLLREVVSVTRPYANSLQHPKRSMITRRANQIEEGEYYWEQHVGTAQHLVMTLQEEGADFGNLEKRLSEFKDKLSISQE